MKPKEALGCIFSGNAVILLATGILAYGIYMSDHSTTGSNMPVGTPTYGPGHLVTPESIQQLNQPDVTEHVENCAGYPADITCRYGSCEIHRDVPGGLNTLFTWFDDRTENIDQAHEICTPLEPTPAQ